jgi:hypothetical protein
MMAETFPFGKYLGHSVAYVAFHDYSWLGWIDRKGIRRPSLKQEVFKARQALNSFAPVEKCYTCNQTARVFSIAGNLLAWNIEGSHLYCSKSICQNANGYDGMRMIYPIKFDTILSFAGDEWREPNYAIKRFQKILNECVGIQGKLTENNCNDFLDSLVANLAPKPPVAPPVPKQLELF